MRKDNGNGPRDTALGTALGFSAYFLWGLLPIYWKTLSSVDPLQILAHRILWAAFFSCILLAALRGASALASAFKSPGRRGAAVMAGLLVTVNWGVYIWAVNSGHIVESSLGYYLSPLFVVLTGCLFLKERMDGGLKASLGIAAVGVVILAIDYGRVPWIALALALSWTAYSYVKKRAALDPLAGFALETVSVAPLALAFLAWRHASGLGAFVQSGPAVTALLVVAGPVTALPLLLYAEGLSRVPLSRMGLLQYVSPTLQLGIGVLLYGESFGGVDAVAFSVIAAAVVVFLATRGRAAH